MKKIACLFPGIGYTCDKPLLYYSGKLLKSLGWEIVLVPYSGFPSGVKGNAEKMRQCAQTALEQAERILREIDWSEYGEILFVGKSVGTVVCAAYAERHCLKCRQVVFTPVEDTFRFAGRDSIAFHGTADPWADTETVEEACGKLGIPLYETAGANHSLETGDVEADLRELRKVMKTVRKYVMTETETGRFTEMKIGILSDTHDLLRPEVIHALQGCDCILHGGDISSREILGRLEQIAPVKAVRGNNDKEWAEDLPAFLDFELGGLRIYMTHKKKDLPGDLSRYDLVICGHTHQYASVWQEQTGKKRTLLFNPGSCGPRRFIQPITLAILKIDPDGWSVEQINIPHPAKEKTPRIAEGDIHRQVEIVVRETQKGLSFDRIAQKHGLDPDLTEQIVRLYVTHPGVTVDGIMTKLGLLGKL